MITSIEGLILRKTLFKERHILAHILLRNGQVIKAVFYGGAGGGVKKKSSILELGFMLKIELTNRAAKQGLFTAKEWNLHWGHKRIRDNHKLFYMMCLFLEIVDSSSEAQEEVYEDFDENLFSVLSNGIFHLDKVEAPTDFAKSSHFIAFCGKLMQGLGIAPHLSKCMTCSTDLVGSRPSLSFEKGGFVCQDCSGEGLDQELHQKLCEVKERKYSDIDFLKELPQGNGQKLFSYFCYQFQMEPKSIKSFSMLF